MIKNLLFDLDNTLYSSKNPIEGCVYRRMIRFIADFLHTDEHSAAEERRRRIHLYGTTLEWLMNEHGLSDTESYFRSLHPDEEADEVAFDPLLPALLENLGRDFHLSVLTNSPAIHFERILTRLRIYDLFDGMYGIEDNDFKGKPHARAYRHAVEDKGFTVENTLFLDDHPAYVQGFTDLGGKAVLIDEENRFADVSPCKKAPFARLKSVHELPALLKTVPR